MIDCALDLGLDEDATLEDLPAISLARLCHIEPVQDRNLQRGLFAAEGLRAYAARVGTENEPLDTVASDLLGDLMHLCDATGMSFDNLESRGRRHYREEIGGEG